jgi:ATP-binding cassette subfamily B protein
MTYEAEDGPISGHIDLALWARMMGHARPYRRDLAGMGATGVAIAAADTALPLVTGLLIDEAVAGVPLSELWVYGLAYVASLGIVACSIWAFIVLAGRIATGVAHDLRQAGFARFQMLSFSFYDTRAVGWLVSRLTSDVGKVANLLPWILLDLSWGTSLVVGIVVAMLYLNWQLALVVMLIVPPLVVISMVFQRWMLKSSRLVRKTNAEITAAYNEAVVGVRTTKALAREGANLVEFQHRSSAMFSFSVRNALQSAVYLPLVMLMGSVGVGLALFYDGVQVGGGLSLGTLVAFMQYATLFSMPIQEMATQITQLQGAQAAAERVQGLLETESDIVNPVDAVVPAGPVQSVQFTGVGFAYKPGEPVLTDVGFAVSSGQTVALVGPTGGGKSTIVSLLARFYDVTEGAIRVNGVDLRRADLSWLQRQFGIVLQTPHLFRGSVADNIQYGRPEATAAAVQAAAELVHAHGFISALEQGYDTDVGEGGSRLSTGQRQLVSMARAVLADPPIFILDEATSSVDTATERLIQAGIERLLEDRIAFVIAHRLSTIRNADVVLVVSGGCIVEQGDHDSLMRQRGLYWELQRKDAVA